jgi:Tol biopolymer transport system component
MTPERWKRVEELYHAALALPSGERSVFLADGCRDDEALQREVESLLNQPESSGGLLNAPERGAVRTALETFATMSGCALGGYQLSALLGAGSMGEVYRARDEKLGRDVAIKILSRDVTSDPNRLVRFEREARVLASLNHPNICAIYGFEEADGHRFLILELVDGETLNHRIARVAGLDPHASGLPIDDVLRVARQLAEALEVAHEKGIVHRDLKPANVTITADGVVKVLDFGLAKLTSSDAPEPHPIGGTQEGVILGTAAYMSPQQARGQIVDKRADIWAFGCVVYEMLTGRVAFAGETVSDTIGKILEREPDWSALPAETPSAIQRLLRRCLAKDAKQRLRDIGDVRIEIDAIDERSEVSASMRSPRPAKTRAAWLPWVALVAIGAGVGLWEARRPATVPADPLADARFTRLTDWEGTEGGAEISPDGKFVAFLADRDGQFDIWLSQVGTGVFRNLTADIPALQPIGPTFRKFGFSGDGSEIWFSPDTGPSMAQMIMPLMGGAPRTFLQKGATAPSWSPDGSRIAYFKNNDSDPLFVADRTGENARQILAEEGVHHHNPAWSSDSQWIYFARGPEPTDPMDVWRIRPSGGSPEPLTERGTAVNFLASLDSRTLLYVAREEDRSGPWLWALDVERKVTRRAASGLGQYTSVSASRDGRRVVATVANPTSTLWRVPLLDRPAQDRDVQSYPLPTARALAPRFVGTSLFYLSTRGIADGLWRIQDGHASEVWKGADGRLSEPAAVSPDGSRTVIIVRRDGTRRLIVVSADGRGSQALAPSLDIQVTAGQSAADWSPDGKWIVAGGRDPQGTGLFKIPSDGGAPVRLLTGQAGNPVWSPDGNLIVYSGKFFTGQAELLGVRPDGTPVDLSLPRARPGGYRFLPNGTGMVYLPFLPSVDFWLVDFATRTPRRLTRLSYQGALGTFDITPDGKAIVFDRSRENSDIVLIERPN